MKVTITKIKVYTDKLFACGIVKITADDDQEQELVWTAARESVEEPWDPKHIGLAYEPTEILVSPTVIEKEIVKHLLEKS